MDKVIDFLLNNYIWVGVIALILIFALVGYLVDFINNSKLNEDKSPEIKQKLAREIKEDRQ